MYTLIQSHRTQLIAVLFLCFAIRLACLLFYPVDPSTEVINPDEWDAVATNLTEGRGYVLYVPQAGVYDWNLTESEWAYRPTMRAPPVYPMVLAGLYSVTGVNHDAARLLQILFDVLTAWVVYRLAGTFFDRRIGLLAALGWACYLPEITHVLKLRAEPIFTLLLCLWVWVEGKRLHGGSGQERHSTRALILSTALLALLALCRPAMLIFAVLYLPYLAIVHRSYVTPAVVMIALIGPWLLRGFLLFGALVPVASNGGYSLYRSIFTIYQADYITDAPPDFLQAYDHFRASIQGKPLPQDEVELDVLFRSQAVTLIRDYPLRYLHLCLENVMRLWFRLYGGTLAGWKDWVTCLMNMGLLLLAAIGIRRGLPKPVMLLPVVVCFNTLFYSMTLADPRYNTPIIPLVLVLAAWGLMTLRHRSASS